MSTPASAPQHLQALQHANRVRLARAELKRRVARGALAAEDVVLASPWEATSMPVLELLMSQRRWGSTRARKVLSGLGLPETKTVGAMTERQRRALARELGRLAVRPPEPDREMALTGAAA